MAKSRSKVEKIATGFISRNLALGRLSGATMARFLVRSRSPEEVIAFLGKEAEKWVAGMGRLKGPIMKAGQLIAIIDPQFIPAEIKKAFQPLNEESIELSGDAVRGILRRRLKKERLDLLDVDYEAYRAASIGQVHRARIKATGEEIILKIQYPGMAGTIDTDMKTLRSFLNILRVLPGYEKATVEGILQDIRTTLVREMDYRREGRQLQVYQEAFADDPRFKVPKIYEKFSTKTILALEYVGGESLTPAFLAGLEPARKEALGLVMLELFLREFCSMGLIQTDAHASNYRLRRTADGRDQVVLLDFGAVRPYPAPFVARFCQLARQAWNHDREGIRATLFEGGYLRQEDPEEVPNLYTDLVIRVLACMIPADHPFHREPKIYLNSPEWGGFLVDWHKDLIAAGGLRMRPVPADFVMFSRRLAGFRQLCESLDSRWDTPAIYPVLRRWLDLDC